jgi:hypothetical protein
MIGIIFVVVGVLWLLETMGFIVGDFWGFVWPVIIILIGLSMIDKKSNKCCSFKLDKGKKK